MRKYNLLPAFIISITVCLVSCRKEIQSERTQAEQKGSISANKNTQNHSVKIYASNISELYEAINNPDNESGTIVLAPGTYLLNAGFPKAGRLELLSNMSLVGQPGHPESVVIDATELPLSSFTIAPTNARTGAVRMGDGFNSVEWITFQNDPAHTIRSLIQTDIVTSSPAKIKVAHCVIKGSSIGLSILNRDPEANGRVLDAIVEDNEIMNNIVPQFGSGIQIQNTLVDEAVLRVNLSRNYIHDNKSGMLIFNSTSRYSTVEVKSYDNRIENNGIGMVLNGGFILSAAIPTMHNSLNFEGFATTIKNNNGLPAPPFLFPATGVHAAAGQSMPPFDIPGSAQNNQLSATFHGCDIEGNTGNGQINVYGAHSFYPMPTPAGSNNTARIFLYGLSANASVYAVNSFPDEPEGTNTATVYR